MRNIAYKSVLFFVVLLIFLFPTFASAQLKLPEYVGYVNDFENIISNDEELNSKLTQFEKDTTVELAVITVNDFSDTTIEDYGVKLFEKWKLGKADVDNGLLLIISSNLRQSRIEVGYGLEGTLPDALTGRIQGQYMIPNFKEGKYSEGINAGIDALIGVIKEDPTVVSLLQSNSSKSNSSWSFDLIVTILFFSFYLMAASKSWWLGGVLGFGIGLYFAITNNLYFLILFTTPLGFLIDYILSKTTIGRAIFHGVSSGVFRSGSSGGGGGVSFGGGSSGGGGSSRSW